MPCHKAVELTFVKKGKATKIPFLCDTGSNVSIISSDYLKHCGDYTVKPSRLILHTANNERLDVRGEVQLDFTIAGRHFTEVFTVSSDVCNCLQSLRGYNVTECGILNMTL